jgi:hypothetical protein
VQALAALIKGGAASPLAGQAYFIGSSFSSTDVPRLSYGQFNGLPQSEGESSQLDHWGHPPPRLLPLPLVNALARFNEALFGNILRRMQRLSCLLAFFCASRSNTMMTLVLAALTGCTFDDMLRWLLALPPPQLHFRVS